MKSHADISAVLRKQLNFMKTTQDELGRTAGVSRRTLTHVLNGEHDFKLSTLLALADRLGLEMMLVPKSLAGAVSAGATNEPMVKTRVQSALDRLNVARNRAGTGA